MTCDDRAAGPATLPEAVRYSLSERCLLPDGLAPPAQPWSVSVERRIDSARGALLGTAIGDALGRPAEGRHPSKLQGRAEAFRDYQPWRGHQGGPVGTVTDDTQMTICVARSMLAAGGRVDPGDLAQRFIDWLPEGRGKGHTCVSAVEELRCGSPWWQAGQRSAGNGAAMRVAPIGIALGSDTQALCHDAALSAVITHADPMATAAAIGHAWLIARLAVQRPHQLDVATLIDDLADAISVIDDPGAPERHWQHRRSKTATPVTLAERVREVPRLLEWPIDDVFDHLYNGAFVLETLPAALWCFLRHLDDPEEAVVTAVLRGHDADTVASMTAAYLGALHGTDAFPDRWTGDDLEYRSELVDLADRLAALSVTPDANPPASGRRRAGPGGSSDPVERIPASDNGAPPYLADTEWERP